MNRQISQILKACRLRPGATPGLLGTVAERLGISLPTDYVEFLRLTNGTDGFVGENYVIMRSAEELRWYGDEDCMPLPFLLIIGSDGGGEAFAYDTRVSPFPIVNVPFIGMEEQLIRVLGHSILEFLERLERAPLFPPLDGEQKS